MKVFSDKLSFGDIYWIPRKYAPRKTIGDHWGVVLYASESEQLVIIKTLSSRLFWVFFDFGLFVDNQCQSCKSFKEYKIQGIIGNYNKNIKPIDVDCVTFLNHDKYSFLNRSTFLAACDIFKDNYFDFYTKMQSKKYIFNGSLLSHNKRNFLFNIRYSNDLSDSERKKILSFGI